MQAQPPNHTYPPRREVRCKSFREEEKEKENGREQIDYPTRKGHVFGGGGGGRLEGQQNAFL